MKFSLKLTKLRVTLNFPHYNLPYWLGNKFRGGFGSVLLKAVCGYLRPECRDCSSKDDCLYYALYERSEQKRGKSQPVRAINFIPPFFGRSVAGSGRINLEINVFGDYVRYLPHIIYGLRFLGKIGLNRHSKYTLEKITDYFTDEIVYDGSSVYPNVKTIDLSKLDGEEFESVRVKFITPIELERVPLSLSYLLHMIRRRLILFVNEYGKGEVQNCSCSDELIASDWRSHRLFHTSKRLGKRMFQAYTGYSDYRIVEADENAFKLLKIGSLIGAGAKASFGMGLFKIEPIEI
ncbi:hypothetical protein DRP07_09645 [Archaeoglobales archaeon]|nr:MAG: hypothetical protein DRP07_09645 [Archaeoglobales archaeon]